MTHLTGVPGAGRRGGLARGRYCVLENFQIQFMSTALRLYCRGGPGTRDPALAPTYAYWYCFTR